jgi:hypothetical protein
MSSPMMGRPRLLKRRSHVGSLAISVGMLLMKAVPASRAQSA